MLMSMKMAVGRIRAEERDRDQRVKTRRADGVYHDAKSNTAHGSTVTVTERVFGA
jgi:hypothetical protein